MGRVSVEDLGGLPEAERRELLESLSGRERLLLRYQWGFWARGSQLAPEGDWATWVILAGRGFGKTRAGAEWVRAQVEQGGCRRVALVARTAADARDVMVEGESGLLGVCPPWFKPHYEPSKRRVTWPNGAIATTYCAEEPDQLRGPQHDAAWADELAAWRYEATWSNLQFGLRLGQRPRLVVTTTPRPVKILREVLGQGSTVMTSGRTYDNAANLAPSFLQQIVARYEGTRLGRQELEAEMLDDNPDALWRREPMLDRQRVRAAPVEPRRVVVAIDPAMTAGAAADETGILVVALGEDGDCYVLEDLSGRLSPDEWARRAIAAWQRYGADRVIAEINQGGQLVEHTLRTIEPAIPFKGVRAKRGKFVRAEPVAALYEQGRVHHVGLFATLEDQLCSWTPGQDLSPDRLDALVYAVSELMLGGAETGVRWV